MQKIGEIKAVLNNDMLLISSSTPLEPGEVLDVFTALTDDRLKDLAGITELFFPKGQIRVVSSQREGLFIAERFREEKERRRAVTVPGPLQALAVYLGPRTEEVIETVTGPWSAELDRQKSLNLVPSTVATVGDLVGRRS
jgi:hypothetical protein